MNFSIKYSRRLEDGTTVAPAWAQARAPASTGDPAWAPAAMAPERAPVEATEEAPGMAEAEDMARAGVTATAWAAEPESTMMISAKGDWHMDAIDFTGESRESNDGSGWGDGLHGGSWCGFGCGDGDGSGWGERSGWGDGSGTDFGSGPGIGWWGNGSGSGGCSGGH